MSKIQDYVDCWLERGPKAASAKWKKDNIKIYIFSIGHGSKNKVSETFKIPAVNNFEAWNILYKKLDKGYDFETLSFIELTEIKTEK